MSSSCRSTSSVLVLGVVFGAVLLSQGCAQPESQIVQAVRQEWTSVGPDGQAERIRFESERILWRYQTKGQYSCPYRVMSFSEKARTVDINFQCKKRTGTDGPITYRLNFSEDQRTLDVTLEGRTVHVFRAADGNG